MQAKASNKDKFSSYLLKRNHRQRNERLEGEQNTYNQSYPRQHVSSPFPFSNMSSHTPFVNSKVERQSPRNEDREVQESFNLSEYRYKQEKEASCIFEDEVPIKRKRLKKLRQLEENQCAICLEQIKKKCQLECKHKFCFKCVQNWFETSNNCPLCRAEIQSFWYKGQEFFVQPKEHDQSYDFSSDLSEQFEQILEGECYNCENTRVGDTVLICDRCEVNSCHIRCDPSLRGVLPQGQWFCHFCR